MKKRMKIYRQLQGDVMAARSLPKFLGKYRKKKRLYPPPMQETSEKARKKIQILRRRLAEPSKEGRRQAANR